VRRTRQASLDRGVSEKWSAPILEPPDGDDAEEFRRRGKPDKARYMNIAEGSLEECRYYPILAQGVGYGDATHLSVAAEEVGGLLRAYATAILAPRS
jgi:hypothetical protein